MLAYFRLPALAVVLVAGVLVGCAGPRSASTGTTVAQSGSVTPNPYPVPRGYVSGERVIVPYQGRIQTKCEAFAEPQRSLCIQNRG